MQRRKSWVYLEGFPLFARAPIPIYQHMVFLSPGMVFTYPPQVICMSVSDISLGFGHLFFKLPACWGNQDIFLKYVPISLHVPGPEKSVAHHLIYFIWLNQAYSTAINRLTFQNSDKSEVYMYVVENEEDRMERRESGEIGKVWNKLGVVGSQALFH